MADVSEHPPKGLRGFIDSPRGQREKKRVELLVKPSADRPVYSIRMYGFLLTLVVIALLRYHNFSGYVDESIFPSASDPNQKIDPYISHPNWLLSKTNWHYYAATILLTIAMWYINFVSTPSFLSLRPIWSTVSSILLCKKLYDFYNFGRLLYLIDFCYFANFCFAYALWNVPLVLVTEVPDLATDTSYDSDNERKGLKGAALNAADGASRRIKKAERKIKAVYGKEFPNVAKAIFCVMNGPVGGGTFMLGTALAFHHPDAFSSFWLHVVPMWFTYALRWRFYPRLLEKNYPDLFQNIDGWLKRDTYWAALKYFYGPWVLSHATFLIAHPYTPLAKYESLFDWVAYGGLPEERSDTLGVWTGKVLGYCAAHFVLSSQGMMAATLAFKYQLVHFVWILCVFINCSYMGFKFYENTVNPPTDMDLSGEMSPVDGLKRCGCAWLCVLPAYAYCKSFPESAIIQRSDVKKRREERKAREAKKTS